jgi:heptosyltransferase III
MSKTIQLDHKTVLISRTDSIGDVVLTLPICVWLKQQFPSCKIVFLGNNYTKSVLNCLPEIDLVLSWNDFQDMPPAQQVSTLKELNIEAFVHVFPNKAIASLAKKAKIPYRIGTSHRSFHLLSCNVRLNFSRKKSNFHESQLNFELLKPFGIQELPDLDTISCLIKNFQVDKKVLPASIEEALKSDKKKIILHPKSQGSALEWPIENYIQLANELLEDGHTVFFTGTKQEGDVFRTLIPIQSNCYDTTGLFTLDELIYFISQCDALVACSTGPLHLAGILGLRTVGLFSPKRPIHPGRWKALGNKVEILVFDENCPTCKQKKACDCITNINVNEVFENLLK